MANPDITAARLRELFAYDPETGVVTRKITVGQRGQAGVVVGCLTYKGYLSCRVDGRFYLLHRLIFLYVHGRFPVHRMDHRNGIRTDNRISNLREATVAENGQNVKTHTDNGSGILGVSWHKKNKKWRASIGIDGTHKHLGYFDDKEAAQNAYAVAKLEMHKFQPKVRN